MRSGNLKHKIEIQAHEESQNDFGEQESSWSKFQDAYSSILPISAKETFTSKKLNAEITHKILIRFIPGVKSDMRIVYGSRIFNIDSVINIREENKTLQIMVTENV